MIEVICGAVVRIVGIICVTLFGLYIASNLFDRGDERNENRKES